MTNVDKALLLAEWSCKRGAFLECPVCLNEADGHAIGCAMDLALSERGFCTHEERCHARGFINVATAPTLPPPEEP